MVKLALLDTFPIDKAHSRLNDELVTNEKRGYLGMSSIGNKCHRYLQFIHYGCLDSEFTERIARLFEDGHNAEPQLIEALKKIGIVVYGEQQPVTGVTGFVLGHIDGIGAFEDGYDNFVGCDRFLLEFKTHNQKSFDELKKTPDLGKTKPIHLSQMISYMHELKLEKGLYVAKNKNTSEIHIRVIDYDADHYDDLRRKEVEVITADTLLPRIGNDNITWFECKLCNAKDVCFGRKSISHDCRNCQHVDIEQGGIWRCSNSNERLLDFTTCDNYKVGEIFDCTN